MQEQLQALITHKTLEIVIILSLVIAVITLAWIVPILYRKKQKAKKTAIKNSLIAQIALTVICLLFCLTTIPDLQTIADAKRDIEEQSYITYTGEYSIELYHRSSFTISDLWFDLRTVTINNTAETLWMDVKSDSNLTMSGTATIVYGKHSRYVLKIENDAP